MDRVTSVFIGLLAILFLGQVLLNENFVDASSSVTISLTDLLAAFGSVSKDISVGNDSSGKPVIIPNPNYDAKKDPSSPLNPPNNYAPGPYPSAAGSGASTIDAQFINTLRADIKNNVKDSIRDSLGSSNVITDSCIDSVSSNQSADFMRYIPGKNPADYIRKDSIPCYGCSVP
jgi:hypothetical protein